MDVLSDLTGRMEKLMKIKVLFECYAPNIDTVDDVCNNFLENYGYLGDNEFEEDEYSYKKKNLHVVWVAEVEKLSDEKEDTLIRMTHHAEGIYEVTDAEYSHCETCINGIWYGRN